MIDIDRLERVDDDHGTLIADRVLAAVAKAIGGVLGPCDPLGRFGSEECVALLVDRDLDREVLRTTGAAVRRSLRAQRWSTRPRTALSL